MRRAALPAIALLAVLACAAPAEAAGLRAGAGRADITPPTGYYFLGWVRSDAKATGQHTRLFARAIVLEKDGRKLALVAADLGAIPGGMLADAAVRAGSPSRTCSPRRRTRTRGRPGSSTSAPTTPSS
jgi:hypothetical protein